MSGSDKTPVTMQELLVSSFAQTDALAKLLIEKGIITRQEFLAKISEERATYQPMCKPIPHLCSMNLTRKFFVDATNRLK